MDSVDHAWDAAGQARGPARTQAIAARWLSLLLAVSAAVCARADPVAPIDDQALVGLTVAEAIRRAGIRPEAVRLYTEPPGVPRGVGGADERGHRVIVFFARGGRPLD